MKTVEQVSKSYCNEQDDLMFDVNSYSTLREVLNKVDVDLCDIDEVIISKDKNNIDLTRVEKYEHRIQDVTKCEYLRMSEERFDIDDKLQNSLKKIESGLNAGIVKIQNWSHQYELFLKIQHIEYINFIFENDELIQSICVVCRYMTVEK